MCGPIPFAWMCWLFRLVSSSSFFARSPNENTNIRLWFKKIWKCEIISRCLLQPFEDIENWAIVIGINRMLRLKPKINCWKCCFCVWRNFYLFNILNIVEKFITVNFKARVSIKIRNFLIRKTVFLVAQIESRFKNTNSIESANQCRSRWCTFMPKIVSIFSLNGKKK